MKTESLVRLLAGSVTLAGVLLAWRVSPWWLLLPAFGPDRLALRLVLGEERGDADLVDRPLEARLVAVVAIADAVEHAEDRARSLGELLDGDELLDDDRVATQR